MVKVIMAMRKMIRYGKTEIEKFGIQFLRFDDLEVRHHLDGVLKTIENWICEFEKNR